MQKSPFGVEPNRPYLGMLSCNSHHHTSKSSSKSKARHKDAKTPTHKNHAKHRDKEGKRNAPESRQADSEIWYTNVEDEDEFLAVEDKISKDSRGRHRKEIGFSIVYSPPLETQARLNAAIEIFPSDGKEVLNIGDRNFRKFLDDRFKNATRIDARHCDKEKIHWESITHKRDRKTGKVLKSCKWASNERDSPGVAALASQAAVNKEKYNFGAGKETGKRWNSKAAIELSLELEREIEKALEAKSPELLAQFNDCAINWFAKLKTNISDITKDKRKREGKTAIKELEKFIAFKLRAPDKVNEGRRKIQDALAQREIEKQHLDIPPA